MARSGSSFKLNHCSQFPIAGVLLAPLNYRKGGRVIDPAQGLDAVLVAVELVIESGALSTEHVLNVLARLNAPALPPQVQSSLALKEAPIANTGRYDSLRGDAVEGVSHA